MLRQLSRREFIRRMCKMGFTGPFSGGRHQYLKRGTQKIILPNPHNDSISVAFLKRILGEAGLIEEFLKQKR